jgi:hypothetical protein
MELNGELKLTICSDGGVRNNIAGFGVIVTIKHQPIMTIKHRLPHIYNTYLSHRSEAFGVLSALQVVSAVLLIKQTMLKIET